MGGSLLISLYKGIAIYTENKLCNMNSYINHADLTSFKQLKARPLFGL